MAAITDLSDLVNRLTGGNSGTPQFDLTWIDNRVGAAAATAIATGRLGSLWLQNKSIGGAGVAPGAVAAPTNATQGALRFVDPGGGRQKWLLGFYLWSSASGMFILYDRLLHISGLDGTSTGAQTVGGTLTRYTSAADCVGNQIWVEVYTQIGATGTTVTASYTNQAGTAGRTTQAAAIGATGLREAQRLIPLALQDGDTGVQAVASVTLAGTTGTAGNFGVTVAHPLGMVNCVTGGIGAPQDFISGMPGLNDVKTGACLAVAQWSLAGLTVQGWVGLPMVEA